MFSPAGVDFQDGDAWYHVRTARNLAAHFPFRSAYDPYALHPGGQPVVTGPLWDLLVAGLAWLAGLGSPRPETLEIIAAWLPALTGMAIAGVAFLVARRLFGEPAGLFAAWWAALIPGGFLWLTHLGLADHHAAESLLSLLVLYGVLRGSPALTGIALGLYLANRPAGIFVPGLLALGVMAWPALGPLLLRSAVLAAAVFLPAFRAYQADYAWLALAALVAVAAVARLERRWFAWTALLAAGILGVWFLRPDILALRRYFLPSGGFENTVQELVPLLQSQPGSPAAVLLHQLGTVWILGVPALLGILWRSWRIPEWRLFALWAGLLTVATFLQTRMIVYGAAALAMAAGAASAWLFARHRWLLAVPAALLAAQLPAGLQQVAIDAGPTPDWRLALGWLREHSPEPFSGPGVWLQRFDAAVPPARYGVAASWDAGYWIQYLARRPPLANGTQSGAREMAAFYLDTAPGTAARLGARYVLADPSLCLFPGPATMRFTALVEMAREDLGRFQRLVVEDPEGARRIFPIYRPDYYRTQIARLFLHDGARHSGGRVGLWRVEPWQPGIDRIVDQRFHPSEAEAAAAMAAHPGARFIMGCLDPGVSCVPLEPLPGVRRVYTSDPLPISPERPVRAVKVFEVTP